MKGLILSTLIACALSLKWDKELTSLDLIGVDLKATFEDWSNFFGKTYPDVDETAHRFGVWMGNLYRIALENDKDLSYKLRMNQFGDMTNEEFKYYINGKTGSCLKEPQKEFSDISSYDEKHYNENPSSVDWTTQGVVTPVKNQGQCGSCWSFSATGSMECDYAIKHGTLTSLSEQQLVDCSGSYGNEGCNGGWYYYAWDYAEHEGGLCSETEYPYTARDGTCKASTCGTKYNKLATNYDTKITADNENALETASVSGCVSVAIEADQTAFQYYSSGVLTGNCGTRIDHAVLVVGYGTQGTQEYWKVKNSWGVTWGEQGYVLICKDCNKNGNKGECGINMYPYMPNFN